jgi:hypothetical protein
MHYLMKELETIVGDTTVTTPVVAKPATGFFAMKEELTLLLETSVTQIKQRQEQMRLYGRTRLAITLGIKAQRNMELAKEKLDALERQVERDHTKWISPMRNMKSVARCVRFCAVSFLTRR